MWFSYQAYELYIKIGQIIIDKFMLKFIDLFFIDYEFIIKT